MAESRPLHWRSRIAVAADGVSRLGVAFALAALAAACGDAFLGDTDKARIGLAVDPALTKPLDEATRWRPIDGGRGYLRVLSPTLPPGAEAVVVPYVKDSGGSGRDGGPLTQGELTAGPGSTWADVVAVESDRPQIVSVERVERAGVSDLHAARIVTRERGEARVTFRVQPLDETGRPSRDPPIEDSMMIEVRR